MQITFTRRRLIAVAFCFVLLLTLPGCASMDKLASFMGMGGGTSTVDSPESLVMGGIEDFNHGDYRKALEIFQDVQERFPFSSSSMVADLKSADCQYYLAKYLEAIAAYEEFEGNYPTNEALPYVLFQIARSHYKQIDEIDRDPGAALDAIAAFSRLLKAYPLSPYTKESEARLRAAKNFLANHEMYVASYYLRTKDYDQAKGRLQYLLANFPGTTPIVKAEELLAAIESGNPPQRTWRDWVPDIGLPDWKTFTEYGTFGGMSGAGAPQ